MKHISRVAYFDNFPNIFISGIFPVLMYAQKEFK